MASNAPIKWAQRKDSIYLTIALADVKNESIQLTANTLTFTGTSGDKQYQAKLDFVSILLVAYLIPLLT